MTISDVLAEVDELKPNQYDDSLKIKWLSNLEARIVADIIETHEQTTEIEFNGYDENDMSQELIVGEPYSDIYKFYLFAMIDFYNAETERYANSLIMFNSTFSDFAGYYNRTHMPLGSYLKI